MAYACLSNLQGASPVWSRISLIVLVRRRLIRQRDCSLRSRGSLSTRGIRLLKSRLAVVLSLLVAGNLVLGQSGSPLTGAVRDLSGAPVAGVLVTLSSLDRAFQTKSATDGWFRFEKIPKGKYDLELSAPGFVKQRFPVDVSEVTPQALTIVLKIGSVPDMNYCGAHPSVSYHLLQSNSPHLTGIVRDYSDEKPVSNATVSLWRTGEERPAFTSNSDQMGRVEFNDVPAGHYDLRILRRGYRPAELKQLLIPRESGTSVDFPIEKRKGIVICQ